MAIRIKNCVYCGKRALRFQDYCEFHLGLWRIRHDKHN